MNEFISIPVSGILRIEFTLYVKWVKFNQNLQVQGKTETFVTETETHKTVQISIDNQSTSSADRYLSMDHLVPRENGRFYYFQSLEFWG